MTISFTGTIKPDQTIIELAESQGTLTISTKKVEPMDNSFELYFQNRHCELIPYLRTSIRLFW